AYQPTIIARIGFGAVFLLLLHAYPFAIITGPFFGSYYLFLTRYSITKPRHFQKYLADILAILFGGLFVTALLGLWSIHVGGYFLFFFGTLSKLLSGTALSMVVEDRKWIFYAHYLLFPFLSLGLSMAYSISARVRCMPWTNAEFFCLQTI